MSHEEEDQADPAGAAPNRSAPDVAPGDGEHKERPKLSPMLKIVLAIGVVILIVAGLIWFIHYETRGKYLQSTNDATIAADAVTVAPRVSGYVGEVFVVNDQDVRQGDALARIDSRDYRARAEQAQAQIAQSTATSETARAAIAEQYATIEQTRAQLAGARAKAAHDAAEVARYLPLAASGAETRQRLAELQATAVQSAQDARAQAAAVVMQQRHIGGLRGQLLQGEAQGQGARAQLASANVDVRATLIRAAINGRIGDKAVTVGQYVQAGTRLMSLVPLDQIYIIANFKETQLALMRLGQPATIEVDALGGTKIHGRVLSIAPGTGAQFSLLPPENATGNFTKIVQRVPVRITIDAAPEVRRLLVPGLSVTVVVDTIAAKDDLARIREQEKQRDQARHND